MRINIRTKFSIFIGILLLLMVVILGSLVLRGIRYNQRGDYEEFLFQQVEVANLYLTQEYLSSSYMRPQDYLNIKGSQIAKQLGVFSNELVVLYDLKGEEIGSSNPIRRKSDTQEILGFALDGKIAYQTSGHSIHYMAPLKIHNTQVGVIQLLYSVKQQQTFYNDVKKLFIASGLLVFIASLAISIMYFNSFSLDILKLKKNAEGIRRGEYSTVILPRRDELGELSRSIHYMGNQIRDSIKEIREERDKLKLAVAKLSALEKQQKQFIGDISHEFKTPLTSMRAYLDLLEMYPDDIQLFADAKVAMLHETTRLHDMVNRVIDVSSMEKYQFELNIERIDIKKIIESILRRMKGRMEKQWLRLNNNICEGYAYADKELIEHALVNLVDNAIKYNYYGGEVSVHSYCKVDTLCIEISNTGGIIPREEGDKIFEPFYRVDKNRSRKTGGTGLGLALVKKIIEKQNGIIQLKKSDKDGTVFLLCLPTSIP